MLQVTPAPTQGMTRRLASRLMSASRILGDASDWSRPLSPSPRIDLYLSCGGEGDERGGLGLSGTISGKHLLGTGVGLFKPDEGMKIIPSSEALILLGKVFEGATKKRFKIVDREQKLKKIKSPIESEAGRINISRKISSLRLRLILRVHRSVLPITPQGLLAQPGFEPGPLDQESRDVLAENQLGQT